MDLHFTNLKLYSVDTGESHEALDFICALNQWSKLAYELEEEVRDHSYYNYFDIIIEWSLTKQVTHCGQPPFEGSIILWYRPTNKQISYARGIEFGKGFESVSTKSIVNKLKENESRFS